MKIVIITATLMLFSTPAFASYNWSSTPNTKDAIVGGFENYRNSRNGPTLKRKLYVCRAQHKGAMHPGKVVAGKCNIGYGGKEIAVPRFQMLQSKNPSRLYWTKGINQNAIIAGRENGKPLYICTTNYKGGRHPGKVHKGMCHIGYGGKEIYTKSFSVLAMKAPVRPTPPTKNTALKWIQFNGKYPANVVIGGTERGKPLYVCRTKYKGGIHAGKVHANMCHFSYGNKEVYTKQFQTLTATVRLAWSPKSNGKVVGAGRVNNRMFSVCRAAFKGAMHPGKAFGNKCYIGYGGKGYALSKFQYLIVVQNAVVTPPQPKFQWVKVTNGRVPRKAVVGGFENRMPLQICRTVYKGGIHPGKVHKGMCHIGYGGKEIYNKSFEVLITAERLKWRKAVREPVPAGREGNRILHICNAKHKGGLHPGKTVDGKCNIGYGGKELALPLEGILSFDR